jgi:hypothetical protein
MDSINQSTMSLPDELIEFDARWIDVLKKVKKRFGKKPDMEGLLFVIGIQELGMVANKLTKEQKQDLMHVAVCRLLSYNKFYHFTGRDEEGWPHWEPSKTLPKMSLNEQDVLLKKNIIRYFEELE